MILFTANMTEAAEGGSGCSGDVFLMFKRFTTIEAVEGGGSGGGSGGGRLFRQKQRTAANVGGWRRTAGGWQAAAVAGGGGGRGSGLSLSPLLLLLLWLWLNGLPNFCRDLL